MEKKILWASNTYWKSPFQVGANHLSREFVKHGWEILFLSDPISLLHLFKSGNMDGVIDCFDSWWKGVQIDHDERIRYYSPFTPLWVPLNLPFLRSNFVLDSWYKFTLPNIKSLIERNGYNEVDLLVIDTITNGFLIDCVKARKSVYRVTDNFSAFTRATDVFLQREKEIAQKVDVVVYTARSLEPLVDQLRPQRKLFVPNGVNMKHFMSEDGFPKPAEYENIRKPIVLYVGAMNYWFDWDLVNYAASELKDFSFVFIGPEKLALQRIKKLPNIYILGRRSYDILPAYIHNADVGIIPFNIKAFPDLVNTINPIKLYDYLACGIPVVSVKWKELENIHSPAQLADSKEEFAEAIVKACMHGVDKSLLINFAKSNDWSSRAMTIIDSIGL